MVRIIFKRVNIRQLNQQDLGIQTVRHSGVERVGVRDQEQ